MRFFVAWIVNVSFPFWMYFDYCTKLWILFRDYYFSILSIYMLVRHGEIKKKLEIFVHLERYWHITEHQITRTFPFLYFLIFTNNGGAIDNYSLNAKNWIIVGYNSKTIQNIWQENCNHTPLFSDTDKITKVSMTLFSQSAIA